MYQKAAISGVKQAFWTAFGQYMKPVLSAEGGPVNWINYKTGHKHLYFRMDAFLEAKVAIDITHPDRDLQQLYYEQFVQLKGIFSGHVHEPWVWTAPAKDTHAGIFKILRGINIMEKGNWPELISFFKPRMVALDAFWCEARYAFEALR